MSRRERRQIKRERVKQKTRPKNFTPASKGEKLSIIAISLTIIISSLYLALRDNSIPDKELMTVLVTLKNTPKYDEYEIKSTKYQDITLTVKEYQKEFKISAMTYKATNHEALKASVFAGDKVELKVKKEDFEDLNKNTFWNNYNDVYGLNKNGINYINIDLKTKLSDRDSKWSYYFVTIGLVMLPYAFIKRKPLISMDNAILTISIIGLIAIFAVSN